MKLIFYISSNSFPLYKQFFVTRYVKYYTTIMRVSQKALFLKLRTNLLMAAPKVAS